MFKLVKVKGDSMLPCYRHNDYLILSKYLFNNLTVGDDIVCNHPHYNIIFKRIAKITNSNIYLTGLNAASTSSQDLGTISHNEIIGKVVWHIKQTVTAPSKISD